MPDWIFYVLTGANLLTLGFALFARHCAELAAHDAIGAANAAGQHAAAAEKSVDRAEEITRAVGQIAGRAERAASRASVERACAEERVLSFEDAARAKPTAPPLKLADCDPKEPV